MRRGLIVDAAQRLLAEQDPLLVTFDQVAQAAGVSRPLVHTYLGDRRGLLDAVQVGIVGRLDTWVGHGLGRATDPAGALRAMVGGVFAFVESDREGWGVLVASGGLDHPALHGVRSRWVLRLTPSRSDDRADVSGAAVPSSDGVGGEAAVAALLFGVGSWVSRGTDPAAVTAALAATITVGDTDR